jgi:hypothetical protein
VEQVVVRRGPGRAGLQAAQVERARAAAKPDDIHITIGTRFCTSGAMA